MDPNPRSFPVLSYVMSRLPSFGGRSPTGAATASPSNSHSHNFDVEQPPQSGRPSSSPSSSPSSIVGRMPNLTDPEMLASMIRAISDVSQARSVLKLIGARPTHEEVDDAKAKLVDLEAHLSRQLEEIVGHPRPPEIDETRWRAHIAQKENACKESAEKEKRILKSLIQLDFMHASYEKLLKDAENRLVKIYEHHGENDNDTNTNENDNDNDGQVEEILNDAYGKGVERVDLSGKHLKHLPDAFSHLPALVILDISANQLSLIPDSISGLENLEELNVSSNGLESLPDTIGLLQKLKLLNVSGNKLCALPDSISLCKELVELDAGFNSLTYLPTNIGYQLHNLQRLMIQLNKIRSLPSSVCEMKSLRYLDAHFNELHGLPVAIGKLTNLEVLNLSSNFTDLQVLPETFGDLISLRELDLSNNQIHALPDSFGRLDNLTKLNLDQNPLEVPPLEIANQGAQAVKSFMLKRWADILAEEERKSPQASQEDGQNDWVARSTTWLKNVSENVSEIISPRTPKTSFLDQQL